MRIKFVGNRRFVLEELMKLSRNVEINVIAGSHLERDTFLRGLTYNLVGSKSELVADLEKNNFDILISNGLPYILNFDSLPKNIYVNIHPSFLPDLRGIDPVLGAILFKRDAGATCHLMDNGIDTGPIISRVKIPYSEDLTASLLYQLSFDAEKKCFLEAWKRKFRPLGLVQDLEGTLYFSRKADTRVIPLTSSESEVIQVVRAFDNSNQGARFYINDQEIVCYSAWISKNEYLLELFKTANVNEVVMAYEDTIAIKRIGCCIFLSKIKNISQDWIGRQVTGR